MDLNIAIFDKVYIYSFSEEYLAFSFSEDDNIVENYRVSQETGNKGARLVCNRIFKIETILINLHTISDSISPILGLQK